MSRNLSTYLIVFALSLFSSSCPHSPTLLSCLPFPVERSSLQPPLLTPYTDGILGLAAEEVPPVDEIAVAFLFEEKERSAMDQ